MSGNGDIDLSSKEGIEAQLRVVEKVLVMVRNVQVDMARKRERLEYNRGVLQRALEEMTR